MFKILDGRNYFYQWDIDRQIIVNDPTITEVHFCNRTDVCSLVVEVKDGIANVPNKVLQSGFKVRVFGYDGKATLHEATFEVKARTKPFDYVYTETEIKHYADLEARLDEIEREGFSEEVVNKAVSNYLDENSDILDGYYTKEEVDNTFITKATSDFRHNELRNGIADLALSFLGRYVDVAGNKRFPIDRYNKVDNFVNHLKTCPLALWYGSQTYIVGIDYGISITQWWIVNEDGSQTDGGEAVIGGYLYTNHIYLYSGAQMFDLGEEAAFKKLLSNSLVYDNSKSGLTSTTIVEAINELASRPSGGGGDIDLTGYATEEYVDNAIANIDFPEAPEVDLSSCIKFYNFSSLASPSEADYAKLKEIIETDNVNAYLFTVEGTHKILRTSNLGGGNILIVYGVWNGPTDNTIYGYQVDYKNAASTLLVSYKMTSSEEVQSMINEAFNNIGVAEGGAY